MMTIPRSFADLIRMHHRQTIGGETVNHLLDTLHTFPVGKINEDTRIGKTAHRSCPHPADDDRLHLGILQKLHRHHAPAGLMPAVGNGRYRLDRLLAIKLDHRENITVAKMV